MEQEFWGAQSQFGQKTLRLGLSLIVLLASLGVTGPVRAADLSALQAQQKAAAERALAAEKLAAQETAIAKQAAARVAQVSNQIESVKYSLEITSDGISDTNQGIETKNQELAKLESDLRQIQDKQDSIIRQLFILSESLPAEMNWFSNQSISEKTRMESQFKSLKNYASALYTETMTAKLAVESNKRELMTRAEQLKSLQDQQSEQKRALASYKDQQAALKLDAEAAAKQMAAKASAEREKAAKLEGQIRAEIAARQRSAQGYYGKGPGVGKRVSRGEYIGTQGSTGFSTGDHVHFEVDVNGPASGHTSPWPYLNNGTMSWPLRSFVITQDYNEYNCWYSGCRHMGIDISGPIGSAIYAPADGLVVLNEYFGGYGNAWSMKVDNGPYVLIGHMR